MLFDVLTKLLLTERGGLSWAKIIYAGIVTGILLAVALHSVLGKFLKH